MTVQPTTTGVAQALDCATGTSCTLVDQHGSASVFDGKDWHAARAASKHLGALTSVSCPSPGRCVAVGGARRVSETNGAWGTVHPASFHLEAVSCPTTSFCRAAGQGGRTLRLSGGTWHRGPRAEGSLVAIDCTSSSRCLALGSTGAAYALVDGAWQAAGDPFAEPDTEDLTLDCVTATFCMASSGDVAARWDGRQWHAHTIGYLGEPSRVACAARKFCLWADSDGSVARWDGSWGTRKNYLPLVGDRHAPAMGCWGTRSCLVVSAAEGNSGTTFLFHRAEHRRLDEFAGDQQSYPATSCAGTHFCMVIGLRNEAKVVDGTHVSPAGGSTAGSLDCPTTHFCAALSVGDASADTWTKQAGWSDGPDLVTDELIETTGVGCATASYCLAVAGGEEGGRYAWQWDGTSWHEIADPGRAASVSCPAVDDCWAANDVQVRHWDGDTWSAATSVLPDGGSVPFATIACPTTTFCALGRGDGAVSVLHDDTWGEPTDLGPLAAFDCGAADSCTALSSDVRDQVTRYDGTTWTRSRGLPSAYGGPVYGALSCGSAGQCLAVDAYGAAFARS